ncbi:uncharacterized protein V2V93DRAFT_370331 [Kockiozyma suomiensis]|uniref:uncharacterized protein n=1 Tax=Kockiozyma suomiensis TaxID=1337062 RepID=UPI003343BB6E
MAMPSSPRFSASTYSRVYGSNTPQDSSSDATPYLVPVGSPLGPVTPMQLADEEFQFPVSGTSPLSSTTSTQLQTSTSQSSLSQTNLSWRQRQQAAKATASGAFPRASKYTQSTFSPSFSRTGSSANPGGYGYTTTSSFLTSALNASAYAADVNQLRRQSSNGASANSSFQPLGGGFYNASSPSPLASPMSPRSPLSPAMSDGDVEEMEDLKMDGI